MGAALLGSSTPPSLHVITRVCILLLRLYLSSLLFVSMSVLCSRLSGCRHLLSPLASVCVCLTISCWFWVTLVNMCCTCVHLAWFLSSLLVHPLATLDYGSTARGSDLQIQQRCIWLLRSPPKKGPTRLWVLTPQHWLHEWGGLWYVCHGRRNSRDISPSNCWRCHPATIEGR